MEKIQRRMMRITLKCMTCEWEKTEDYERQNPDRLVFWQCCPRCQHALGIVKLVPYIEFEMREAEQPQACWQCGDTHQLHTYLFNNGVEVQLCQKHFKRYAKQAYKMTTITRPMPEEIRATMADLQPFIDDEFEYELL